MYWGHWKKSHGSTPSSALPYVPHQSPSHSGRWRYSCPSLSDKCFGLADIGLSVRKWRVWERDVRLASWELSNSLFICYEYIHTHTDLPYCVSLCWQLKQLTDFHQTWYTRHAAIHHPHYYTFQFPTTNNTNMAATRTLGVDTLKQHWSRRTQGSAPEIQKPETGHDPAPGILTTYPFRFHLLLGLTSGRFPTCFLAKITWEGHHEFQTGWRSRRRSFWSASTYCSSTRLGKMEETTRNLGQTIGTLAEIRTGHLSNTHV
jgi:hypothetical protein